MAKDKKKLSAFAVIEIILIILLALIMIVMLGINFMFKNKNSPVSLFGYSFYNTKAVNMLPNIPQNTLIIAKTSEAGNIDSDIASGIQPVILCKIGESTALIRVDRIEEEDGQKFYVVKFDAAAENETFRVSGDAILAKAVWQINGFGSFINFASSPVGIIIAVVIPLIFIIAIQVARILSIHRLEDEAAALDDIDEFMTSREEDSPSPVTFSEPKFIEDITGNFSKLRQPGVTAYTADRAAERPAEKVLSVDGRGKAAYTERKDDPGAKKDDPLYTYDRISKEKEKQDRKDPLVTAARPVSRDELYMNKPTRIERSSADEFFDKYTAPKQTQPEPEKSSVVFTPHLSNIIPDSIAAVQEQTDTAPKKPSGFDESVRSYFEKKYVPAEQEDVPSVTPAQEIQAAIPEKAVLPKETIAPPKKTRSNKAVAELMNIIDAEETKLKK